MTPTDLFLFLGSSMRRFPARQPVLCVTAVLASGPALAHPGLHDGGLAAGMLHPLSGTDHLLAMIAVGLWASGLAGKARFLVPAAFVGVMGLGAALGAQGLVLPGAETTITLSVVLLGLASALRLQVALPAAMAFVALFAAAHGAAHGAEMPALAAPLAYCLGFMTITVLLHGAGLVVGLAFRTSAPRLAGGAIMAAGLVMALAG